MSTSPTNPIASLPIVVTNAPAQPYVGLFRTFLKDHERLLIVFVLVIAFWFALGKYNQGRLDHDKIVADQDKAALMIQVQKDQATAALVAQQAADMKALSDKLTAQNTALEQSNVALATALVKQQKQDATMTPTELTQRWDTLVPQANAKVTPDGVTLPEGGAVATVQQLEQVPVLTSQLNAAHQEIQNDNQLVTESAKQVATLNAQMLGLQLESKESAKVCSDQIAVVKAQAAKSKRRWFYAGVVVGFIGRQIIKAETGW
jgi:vacuolar-type H+-ATPase subunit I/STV1